MTALLAMLPWLALLGAWLLTRGVADELLVRLVARRPRWRAVRSRAHGGPTALASATPRGALLLGLGVGVRGPPLPPRTRIP